MADRQSDLRAHETRRTGRSGGPAVVVKVRAVGSEDFGLHAVEGRVGKRSDGDLRGVTKPFACWSGWDVVFVSSSPPGGSAPTRDGVRAWVIMTSQVGAEHLAVPGGRARGVLPLVPARLFRLRALGLEVLDWGEGASRSPAGWPRSARLHRRGAQVRWAAPCAPLLSSRSTSWASPTLPAAPA